MTTATHEDSDDTGHCRGCGTTIGEEHHPECELGYHLEVRQVAGVVVAVKIRDGAG